MKRITCIGIDYHMKTVLAIAKIKNDFRDVQNLTKPYQNCQLTIVHPPMSIR